MKPAFRMNFPVTTLLLLIPLLSGCGRLFSWSHSGIPGALDSDVLITNAGRSQGITVTIQGSASVGADRALEVQRHLRAEITSGTPGKLLASYRTAVQHQIETCGASVTGSGLVGNEDDVREFSFQYRWRGNGGIVNVFSFQETNGVVEVITHCYEHS